MIDRRTLIRLGGLLTVSGAVTVASAQQYPDKPIKIIVPYAAGGFSDALGRALAQWFTRTLGQPVVVDNKPGAATILGVDAAAKSLSDGYTLLLATGALTITLTCSASCPTTLNATSHRSAALPSCPTCWLPTRRCRSATSRS